MKKSSFICYKSFLEAIEGMDGDTAKATLLAIGRYALEGKMPRGLSPWAQSVFVMAKPQIDANAERYEKSLAGGRPEAAVTAAELDKKYAELGNWQAVADFFGITRQTVHKIRKRDAGDAKPAVKNVNVKKPNDNVNDNVNENENVNEEREGAQGAPAAAEPPAPAQSSNSSVNISAKKASAQAAAPPTREEVDALCKERGYTFDPGTFFAYYAASGWRRNDGTRIADWRAAAELWQARERERKDAGEGEDAARRGARASPAPIAVQREETGWYTEHTVL